MGLPALLLLFTSQGTNETAQASGCSGNFPSIFGIDVDPTGNVCVPGTTDTDAYCTLGAIDQCIQVESTETGPGVPGTLRESASERR